MFQIYLFIFNSLAYFDGKKLECWIKKKLFYKKYFDYQQLVNADNTFYACMHSKKLRSQHLAKYILTNHIWSS